MQPNFKTLKENINKIFGRLGFNNPKIVIGYDNHITFEDIFRNLDKDYNNISNERFTINPYKRDDEMQTEETFVEEIKENLFELLIKAEKNTWENNNWGSKEERVLLLRKKYNNIVKIEEEHNKTWGLIIEELKKELTFFGFSYAKILEINYYEVRVYNPWRKGDINFSDIIGIYFWDFNFWNSDKNEFKNIKDFKLELKNKLIDILTLSRISKLKDDFISKIEKEKIEEEKEVKVRYEDKLREYNSMFKTPNFFEEINKEVESLFEEEKEGSLSQDRRGFITNGVLGINDFGTGIAAGTGLGHTINIKSVNEYDKAGKNEDLKVNADTFKLNRKPDRM